MEYDCRRGRWSRSGSKRVAVSVIVFSPKSSSSVGPGLGLPLRHANRPVFEPGRSTGLTVSDRVREVLAVVALRKIAARVRTPRLLPGQGRVRHRGRDLEHEIQLQGRLEL